MQIANWQFNPGLWPSVALLFLLPLLLRLGFWQLDRAEQKQRLQAQYQVRTAEAALDLNAANGKLPEQAAEMKWRQAVARGSFDLENIFLLDNQVMRHQAGYFVYGVFSLSDEGASEGADEGANKERRILVNYGWVPVGSDRMTAPPIALPAGELTLSGRIKLPPATGIKLADTAEEGLGEGRYRLQEIDLEALKAARGWALLPYVLRLPAPGPSGFLRDWTAPGFGRERHLGYAFQWFALATALAIIYLALNLKRVQRRHEE